MASIVKRGKSYAVVYYVGEGDERHQEWESGLSYNAARSRKAELDRKEKKEAKKKDFNKKSASIPNGMTVSMFIEEFVTKYGLKKWGASSYAANMGLLNNYVYPYLGDNILTDVKTKTIDDYYHFLETEAEPVTNPGKPKRERIPASTINDIHKLLRCAFNHAVNWDYIEKNPFLKATVPEYQEKERKVLSPEQVLNILDFTNRPDCYDYFLMHCAILIAIGCTMRGGEIGGLQWDRVDCDKNIFVVDRVIDRISKKSIQLLSKLEILYQFPNLFPGTKTVIVLKQPKTKGSVRNVEVPASVMDALTLLKTMQDQMRTELGCDGYIDYNLVICQANGRPIMTEHLNKRFKDILHELSDPEIDPDEIVFHSLRHTSASTKLILSNGDYNSVKQAGGWANLEMLTRRYGAHSFANDRERMAKTMDSFLTSKNAPAQETASQQPGAEQVLKFLLESNPQLLTEIVKSVQFANKD